MQGGVLWLLILVRPGLVALQAIWDDIAPPDKLAKLIQRARAVDHRRQLSARSQHTGIQSF